MHVVSVGFLTENIKKLTQLTALPIMLFFKGNRLFLYIICLNQHKKDSKIKQNRPETVKNDLYLLSGVRISCLLAIIELGCYRSYRRGT